MTDEKKLPSDIIKLIEEHTRGLSNDKIANQKHHLVLLEALVKVGLNILK